MKENKVEKEDKDTETKPVVNALDVTEVLEAIAEFQDSKYSHIKANKVNPFHKSKYADYSFIVKQTRPALHDLKLVVNQTTDLIGEKWCLLTRVTHLPSKKSIYSILPLPSTDDPQKLGSGLTYYKRYGYNTILGIRVDDEDDDGNVASGLNTKGKKTQKTDEVPFITLKALMIGELKNGNEKLEIKGFGNIQDAAKFQASVLGEDKVATTPQEVKKVLEAFRKQGGASGTA